MGRIFRAAALFSLFLLLFPGFSNGTEEALPSLITGIQEKYGAMPALSVPYTREVITRSMSMLGDQMRGDQASGQLLFKAPYGLRLEQELPERELIVADHDTLWWYVPGKGRAYRYDLDTFGRELRLISDVFRGLTRLEKNFRLTLLEPGRALEHRIELRPDPPWSEVERMVLTVDCSYVIRVLEIYNPLGGVTRFTLGALTVRNDLSDDLFRFVPPDGVRVMEGR
jgi:outer membrane lipoprotein-sorting protein